LAVKNLITAKTPRALRNAKTEITVISPPARNPRFISQSSILISAVNNPD
jgi:hypothetical protein